MKRQLMLKVLLHSAIHPEHYINFNFQKFLSGPEATDLP